MPDIWTVTNKCVENLHFTFHLCFASLRWHRNSCGNAHASSLLLSLIPAIIWKRVNKISYQRIYMNMPLNDKDFIIDFYTLHPSLFLYTSVYVCVCARTCTRVWECMHIHVCTHQLLTLFLTISMHKSIFPGPGIDVTSFLSWKNIENQMNILSICE